MKAQGLITDELDKETVESIKKRRSTMNPLANWDAENYDPTLRHMQYEFNEDCQLELLSEFDTEEARLLRQMEEEVFDLECESDDYY